MACCLPVFHKDGDGITCYKMGITNCVTQKMLLGLGFEEGKGNVNG